MLASRVLPETPPAALSSFVEAAIDSAAIARTAVEERIARGAGRLAMQVTAFLPDLETTLARFGEEIIRLYANA
jgi:hypothetical protein